MTQMSRDRARELLRRALPLIEQAEAENERPDTFGRVSKLSDEIRECLDHRPRKRVTTKDET